jgi:hypothetical protein
MADSIITQLKALTDGNSVDVAIQKIHGVYYTIKVAKEAVDVDPTIDNTAKTITITKATAPTDSDALKAAISAVRIGGTPAAPAIDATGGTGIDCSRLNFSVQGAALGECRAITLPFSILDQLKALTKGQSTEVAIQKINNVYYTIKFAKVVAADPDPGITIDNTAKTITVTSTNSLDPSPYADHELDILVKRFLLNFVKIGGTSDAPAIDATGGTGIDCSNLDFSVIKYPYQCKKGITLPLSILTQLKALADGQSVDVATEKINDVSYTIKVAKAAADAATKIDNTAKTITITKATAPTDSDALKAAISAVKIGGTPDAPTIDATGGTGINCSNLDFSVQVVALGECTPITLPDSIITQLKALTDGQSVDVATEKINDVSYTIKVAKAAADAATKIDNTAKTITITKATAPTDSDALKAAISAVKIGGTPDAPTIDATGGTGINCSNLDFSVQVVALGECTPITLPDSIITQLKALTDGQSVDVATEKINDVSYTIKVAKAAADAATKIDNTAKTITITKATAPTDSDALKAAISAVRIGGTSDAPAIDATGGTAIICYGDFAKITDAASAKCSNILFASKGYQDVATSILADNKKIQGADNLKPLIKAVLKVDSANDLKAASIVIQIQSSTANSDVNNAAKNLCPSVTDLTKISEDDFKNCVATAFKGYVTMNKIFTNLPNKAAGVLKSDETKFVDFESGLKEAAFDSGQFYFDFTTPICVARPFVSGVEIPSVDVGTCLNQVNTAAYVLLNADATCGNANKADLSTCYKAIADSGLKALYTATPDALLVDFSADYPDVLDS